MVEYIARAENVMVRFTITPVAGQYVIEAKGLARWTSEKLPTRPGLVKSAARLIRGV